MFILKNYAYDDFGNQTLIKTINNESKTPATWNVEYNGENRPIKWTNNATNESIVMYYDYRGRRCGKLFYNPDGIWQSSVKFFYNNFTLIQESTASNIITKEFVWDPSEPVATRPLAMKCNVQNLNLLYTHDANKNVTEVFFKNPDNGLAAHYEYSPFGELRDFSYLPSTPETSNSEVNTITETSNSANASPGDSIGWRDTPITEIDIRTFNPFRFSSEYHDDELNLIYYNYRHYDPATGRFLSRDPIEEQGGTNLYNFLENDGINKIDLLGLLFGLFKSNKPHINSTTPKIKYPPKRRISNSAPYIYTLRDPTIFKPDMLDYALLPLDFAVGYGVGIMNNLASLNPFSDRPINLLGSCGSGFFTELGLPSGWWEDCCDVHDKCYAGTSCQGTDASGNPLTYNAPSAEHKRQCDDNFTKCLRNSSSLSMSNRIANHVENWISGIGNSSFIKAYEKAQGIDSYGKKIK